MNLKEISENIRDILNKINMDKELCKLNLEIVNLIKNDPEYYKDKDYANNFLKDLDINNSN